MRTVRVALGAAAVGLLCLLAEPIPVQAQQPVTLDFVVWEYLTQTIRGFADRFEAENPGIKVNLNVLPVAQYVPKVQLMVTGRTPFDALYVADDFLSQWAPWLEPLDAYPGIRELSNQLNPLAKESLTYQGKLYGLPYYMGFIALTYNEKMLKAAGIQAPPKTWDELVQQAKVLKQKGLSEYPVLYPGAGRAVGPVWSYLAMVASRGGTLFDKDLNTTPEGLDSLRWWGRAVQEWKITSPKMVELQTDDAFRAFMSGEYGFFIGGNWYVGPLWANNAEKSKIVGQVRQALMPGNGRTIGYARLYAVTKFSRHKDEAVKLVKFFGGTDRAGHFVTAKEWVFRNALVWGYPAVGKDPEVIQEVGRWGSLDFIQEQLEKTVHISAVAPYRSPWYGEWQEYAIGVLQKVAAGQATPEAAADQLSRRAKELAAKSR